MPIHDESTQNPRNVVTNLGVYPGTSEALITPLDFGARLRLEGSQWRVQDTDGGAFRNISGNYTPLFLCRSITTNDPDTDGEELQVDTFSGTRVPIRLYAGVDRSVFITRVHLSPDSDIRDIILWK